MGRWRRKRLTTKHSAIEALHAKCSNNGVYSTHFMIQKNLNQLYFMQQEAGIKL